MRLFYTIIKRRPAGGRKRPSSVAEPRMAGATRIGELQAARLAGRSS